MSEQACSRRCRSDLVGSRAGWFIWGVPTFHFLLGAGWGTARAWLWVPSLAVAGSACVANASRCGRSHCFVTGPLFLLGALATLLDATGLVAIDWRWVGIAIVAGTAGGYGLEWIRGKYVGALAAGERCSP